MYIRISLLCLVIQCLLVDGTVAQEKLLLTLQETIALARQESPGAKMAELTFHASRWNFQAFKSSYRPSITLNANAPGFIRSLTGVEQDDGSINYVPQRRSFSSMNFGISQPISLTGGNFQVSSGLTHIDQGNNNILWQSSPLILSLNQPLFQFNPMKWERRLEPMQFEVETRGYVEDLAQLSTDITTLFFAVYDAQQSITIATYNVAVNDTIYILSQGRFDIGKIAENELLQTELQLINARTDLSNAEINYQRALQDLRIALGLNLDVEIDVIPPLTIPDFEIDAAEAVRFARANRPAFMNLVINSLQADRDVEQARKEQFSINLNASYGLNQSGPNFNDVYANPLDRQQFGVSLQMPIFQWGENKSRLHAARANQQRIATARAMQEEQLDQVVYFQVLQLQLLQQQVEIAAKADTIATRRFEVARNRYLVGNIDITDLFDAQIAKDSANRSYIQTLSQYWTSYYNIRRLTLYDFENDVPLGFN